MNCAFEIIENRHEIHGSNEIIIFFYKTEKAQSVYYTFSIQAHISSLVRSIFPHQIEHFFSSLQDAKHAMFDTLMEWTKGSRSLRKALFCFDIMNVDQNELFSLEELSSCMNAVPEDMDVCNSHSMSEA